MRKESGGPAFPQQSGWDCNGMWITEAAFDGGMTLRDYFAAKAMPSIMAHSGGYWVSESLSEYATIAYAMADAMLEARK